MSKKWKSTVKIFNALSTLGGTPMLEGIKNAAIVGVGTAIYVQGQLKVGDHF